MDDLTSPVYAVIVYYMREIKFRTWDADKGAWVYFALGDGTGWAMDRYSEFYESTGLHDKNGKEIYEGDIICATLWDGRPDYDYPIQEVSWFEECGAWSPFADNEDREPYPIAEKCEVIGNIHETPELMEK